METKVLIRKPCAQNLDEMPRVASGIFCTVCKTKVDDLTRFSNEELVEWMKKHAVAKPCGIYTAEQARVPVAQRFLFPFRYAAISLAALVTAKEAKAQVEPYVDPADSAKEAITPAATQQKVITGKVVGGKNNKRMAGVTVYVSGEESTLVTTTTNADGSFECILPYTTDTSYTLTFRTKGYNTNTSYGYVPCDKLLVVHMEKSKRFGKHKRRRVYSKF
jgi:hypothetical protein